MTIKEVMARYKDYRATDTTERNSFITYDYRDGNGKVVVVVQVSKYKDIGKYVVQAVRVSDGKELIEAGRCRPCDSMEDAIDVAGEMF